jgi:tetratricopeptide (TPR) repeat protein
MKLLSAIVVLSLGVGSAVRADEAWYPLAPECRIAAETDDARRALAAFWFEQGRAQVERNAFDQAERSFACSQAIIPHPSTLYNLARAAEWAGEDETALRALREYVEQNPEAENIAEAEELVLAVSARIGQRENPTPPPPPPPPPEEDVDAQAVAGWVAVALAGAGAVAGTVFGALAGVEQQRIDDAGDGVSWSVIAGHEADRDAYLIDMAGCLGAAGAAALTGILLLVLDEDEPPPVEVTPTAAPDGVGLVVGWRF